MTCRTMMMTWVIVKMRKKVSWREEAAEAATAAAESMSPLRDVAHLIMKAKWTW